MLKSGTIVEATQGWWKGFYGEVEEPDKENPEMNSIVIFPCKIIKDGKMYTAARVKMPNDWLRFQ
jgi:hypothetical protein